MVVGKATGGTATTLTFSRSAADLFTELSTAVAGDFSVPDRFNNLDCIFEGKYCRISDTSFVDPTVTLTFAAGVLPSTPVAGDTFRILADIPKLVSRIDIDSATVNFQYTLDDTAGLVVAPGTNSILVTAAEGTPRTIYDAEMGSPGFPIRVSSAGAANVIYAFVWNP